MQMIDFSDVARPIPNWHAQQQTQAAYVALAAAERDFVSGAFDSSTLSVESLPAVAALCRARLRGELCAALTRAATVTLARHMIALCPLVVSDN